MMMNDKQVILASASPRRKELLMDTDISFSVEVANCDEFFDKDKAVEEAIEAIALQKAHAVFAHHQKAVVLGCDTMVVLEGSALGKPHNREEAEQMLWQLSGKTHHVISGVAILADDYEIVFHEITSVTFYDLNQAMITAYLDSDEPYDKAGAYGIQGKGKLFVERIEGDYYNVMGLPVARLYRILKSAMFSL